MESDFTDFKDKKIAVIGLGLIGGSLAKGLKEHTKARVYGFDTDREVLTAATKDRAIDFVLDTQNDLGKMDITFVCLFPKQTIEFIERNRDNFQENSLVLDVSGVKKTVNEAVENISNKKFHFLATHPMAGKEKVGYFFSEAKLFYNASMILVPINSTPNWVVEQITALSKQIKFKKVTVTTAEHHDKVIALTSQLCHIVSSAYVQSPTALEFNGFAAGSFKDLSRVAKLNPTMWAQLFFENREALLRETDILINTLLLYKQALQENNYENMFALLQKGTLLKERLNNEEN